MPTTVNDIWAFTGDVTRRHDGSGTCHRCGRKGILNLFTIVNVESGEKRSVGSECIRRYQRDGHSINVSGTELRAATQASEITEVIKALVNLKAVEDRFDIDSFISYLTVNDGLTVRQIATLLWRLEKHQIEHSHLSLRANLKPFRERLALLLLPEYQYRRIQPFLTPQQKTVVAENMDLVKQHDALIIKGHQANHHK